MKKSRNPYSDYILSNLLPKDKTDWENLIKHSEECKNSGLAGCCCEHHNIIHRIRAEISRAYND